MRVENAGLGTTLSNFPGFSDVLIHTQLLQPPPRPAGKIKRLNCTKCMKSQRILQEGDSGRTSAGPLCLCVQSDSFTLRRGVWERKTKRDCTSCLCLLDTDFFPVNI